MKILHTADWHFGTFRSPVRDGVNLRTEDTKRCMDELIRVAKEEHPDFSLVSGDVFHVGVRQQHSSSVLHTLIPFQIFRYFSYVPVPATLSACFL